MQAISNIKPIFSIKIKTVFLARKLVFCNSKLEISGEKSDKRLPNTPKNSKMRIVKPLSEYQKGIYGEMLGEFFNPIFSTHKIKAFVIEFHI
ncbi:hypothetical protein ACFOG5_23670 [Pedobacter fastidiosus]|uniref:Uncharacterized protein n=1 Tax=Pedobacter fastidiosus TaxID=2765361 RepID=A0ABR7KY63_9SPHI|nr:hypothetical protein [Pedobacter fastidiosus]MBC6113055.1 hypothetical protein [Pedobacter fastidiosus]